MQDRHCFNWIWKNHLELNQNLLGVILKSIGATFLSFLCEMLEEWGWTNAPKRLQIRAYISVIDFVPVCWPIAPKRQKYFKSECRSRFLSEMNNGNKM